MPPVALIILVSLISSQSQAAKPTVPQAVAKIFIEECSKQLKLIKLANHTEARDHRTDKSDCEEMLERDVKQLGYAEYIIQYPKDVGCFGAYQEHGFNYETSYTIAHWNALAEEGLNKCDARKFVKRTW